METISSAHMCGSAARIRFGFGFISRPLFLRWGVSPGPPGRNEMKQVLQRTAQAFETRSALSSMLLCSLRSPPIQGGFIRDNLQFANHVRRWRIEVQLYYYHIVQMIKLGWKKPFLKMDTPPESFVPCLHIDGRGQRLQKQTIGSIC